MRRKRKQLASFLMALCMTASLIPAPAYADGEPEETITVAESSDSGEPSGENGETSTESVEISDNSVETSNESSEATGDAEPSGEPETTEDPEPSNEPEPTENAEPSTEPETTEDAEPSTEPETPEDTESSDEPETPENPEPSDEPETTEETEPSGEPEATEDGSPSDGVSVSFDESSSQIVGESEISFGSSTTAAEYLEASWDAASKTVVTSTATAEGTAVESTTTSWSNGWYIVDSDVTITNRITVTGNVHLILCDGKTLTASGGITADNDNSLTIYGQSGGTGKLISSTTGSDEAGIGAYKSSNGSSSAGTITIMGGVIEASGGSSGAGIGGAGGNSGGGTITIYGGTVTAVGQGMATGIGSGWNPYVATSVTIYGGKITATGGTRAAGIGGGTTADNITVSIYGGIINATGGSQNGTGIGLGDAAGSKTGTIAIYGGTVTASGAAAVCSTSSSAPVTLTVDEGLTILAGNDAGSASAVAHDTFIASHTQTYAKFFVPKTISPAVTLEGWTYGDSPNEPTVTGNDGGGAVTYAYKPADGEDGDYSADAPTLPGDYTVRATIAAAGEYVEAAATANFTVAKRPATVTAADQTVYVGDDIDTSLNSAVLSGGAEGHTLTAVTLTGSGTAAATETGTITPSGAAVTDGTADVSAYYEITYADGVLTVAKRPATVTAPQALELTYSGGEQALVSGGAATGGTLVYSLSETGTYTETVPTGKDAGTYTVWFKADGGAAYLDTDPESVSVTIAPKEVTLTWTDTELTYTGAAQKPAAEAGGLASGDSCAVTVTGEQVSANTDAVPAYTATASSLGNGNYALPAAVTQSFTIAPVPLTVTAQAQSKAYGDADPVFTYAVEGLVGGDTEDGVFTGALSREAGEDAGAYAVTRGNLAASTDYTLTFTEAALTILPKTVSSPTITVTPDSLVYDGTAKEPAVTVRDGETEIPADEYQVSYSGNVDAGGAVVTIEDRDGGNYTVSGTASFSIAKAPLTATAVDGTITYGDAPMGFGVVYDGFVGGDTEAAVSGVGYTYTYEQYGNVGTYAVTPDGLSADNYEITCVGGVLAVEPKEAGLTWGDTSFTYDGTAHCPEAEATGLVNGDECAVTVTGDGTDVGSYTAEAAALTGEKSGNYVLPEERTQSFLITPEHMDLTAAGYTGEYDGAPHTAAVTLHRPAEGGTVKFGTKEGTYNLDASPALTGVGSLTVYYQVSAPNYQSAAGEDTATGALTITITRRPLTVSGLTAKSRVYDGTADAELVSDGAALAGLVAGDDVTVTGTASFADRNAGAGKTVFITDLALTGADAENYALSPDGQQTETTADITAKPLDAAVTLSRDSYVYDGTAKEPAVTVRDGDTVIPESEYAVTYTDNIDVGTASVTITDAAGGNYDVSGGAVFTITRSGAELSIALEDWIYGEAARTPTVTGNPGGGAVTFSYKAQGAEDEAYSSDVPTDAGAYTVRAAAAETDNYAAAEASASFAILPAPHADVTLPTVSVSTDLRRLTVDLRDYGEADAEYALLSWDGAFLTENVTAAGGILRFDTVTPEGTEEDSGSGTIAVTVSCRNYLDYTITVPLTIRDLHALYLDANGAAMEAGIRYLRTGTAYGTLPVPRRTGYRFDGWYTGRTDGAPVTAATRMGGVDVTLYARWSVAEHTVTLVLNGGELDSAALEDGWTQTGSRWIFRFHTDSGPITLPTPSRDGYSFTGWVGEDGLSHLRLTLPADTDRDCVYRADWADGAREAAASFVPAADSRVAGIAGLSDGDGPLDAALREVACDDDTAAPDNMKKNVSVSMEVRVLDGEPPAGSAESRERAELAAEAEKLFPGDGTVEMDFLSIEIDKTVSFESEDGGMGGADTAAVGETGRVLEIPLNYDLTGRYVPVVLRHHGGAAEAMTRLPKRPDAYQDMDGSYCVSGTGSGAVLYLYSSRFSTYSVATSGAESYVVFFDAQGGTETEQARADGGAVPRPADPEKDGYVFTGWYTGESGGVPFDFDADTVKEDTVLYARWERRTVEEEEKTWQVAGQISGGTGQARVELRRDDETVDTVTITLPDEGYVFRSVPAGEYTLTVTQGNGEAMTMPLTVGALP